MNPIQALEILSQLVKSAKLPYNDHVLLEKSVDVLLKAIQQSGSTQGAPDVPVIVDEPIPNVAFEDPTVDSGASNPVAAPEEPATACEEPAPVKRRRTNRTKKGSK